MLSLLHRIGPNQKIWFHPILLFGLLALSLLIPQSYLLLHQQQSSYRTDDVASKAMVAPHSDQPRRLLPTPIILVGMPKTGTSTIHSFFVRSGYRSSHFHCINKLYCGLCIKVAIEQGKPPLQTCGDYEVWTQMDVENLGQCYFPQIHNLDVLHQEAPNATFILTHRNMTHWARSVTNWVGNVRSMAARLTKCKGGPKSRYPKDLIEWHNEHIQRIRDFVHSHPSHTLVEIDIEDPNAGEIMAQRFGPASPATNWGHENNSLERNASKMTTRLE